METIGSLNLRAFKKDAAGKVVESTKLGVSEAHHIPFDAYMASKPYFSQQRTQTVPYNGHEILSQLINKIQDFVPDQNRTVGYVTVFKHHLDVHGYVERINKAVSNNFPLLTPEVPVTEVAFSRIMSKIHILGDERYHITAAMKWEPNFMQIAIGLNVSACDNYNIFAPRLYQTSQKTNYDNLIDYVTIELKKIEESFETDITTVKSLIDTPLNDKSMRLLVGDMSIRYAEENQILGITDLTQMTRNIVADKKDGRDITNMWDFTNHGTKVLHFNNTSGDTTLETIQRFNKYVLEMQARNTGRKPS